MNTYLNYAIEVNVGIVLFFAIYYLLMRNETDFRKQRFFMIAGLSVSIIAPLLHIRSEILPANVGTMSIMLPELIVGTSQKAFTETTFFDWQGLFATTYWIVTALIAVPLLIQGIRLYRLRNGPAGVYNGDYLVIESAAEKTSWSFFNLICIGEVENISEEEKDLILRHEMTHGSLLHSVDIILVTILCVVFWFNPAVWLYRRAMSRIHEFEVDSIIAAEKNKVEYCMLLAKTTVGSHFQFTHAFNKSFILKRIDMINQLKNRISNWKIAAAVSVLALYFVAAACTESMPEASMQNMIEVKPGDETLILKQAVMPKEVGDAIADLGKSYPNRIYEVGEISHEQLKTTPVNESLVYIFTYQPKPGINQIWAIKETGRKTSEPFNIVEESARPPFGMTKYFEQLGQILQYPDDARQMGIEGKVFIEFVVNEAGEMSDYRVVKGIHKSLDAEAMRAMMQLSSMKWSPGMHDGKPVAQKMVLPITFEVE